MHPAPASTIVPPGPDLTAPDLTGTDDEPLEEMAELVGIDDGRNAPESTDEELPDGRRR
jgi:hypothetical protein